ncbi:MAG: hypothetical protein HFE76_03180 [Firmicutes bacterium]|nr:hypothetical protein [Bacillota bacterium]
MAAGIILKAIFIPASAKPFSRYLHYIDRPEAIDQSETQKQVTAYDVFRSYTDYMGNPEKTTGLFDAWQDRLSAKQKADMKELFQLSQEQGGLMYQLLFSFDSRWLKEVGLMDEQGVAAQAEIQSYTRSAVQQLMKEEGMEGWIWSAAMHFNTNHLHVHIALADPVPSWEEGTGRCRRNHRTGELYQRGKLKPKTLERTKAAFVNLAIGAEREQEQINRLVRERVLLEKQLHPFSMERNKPIRAAFSQLLQELPEDMRLWKYHMAAMDPYRSQIDNLSSLFFNTYLNEEYREFQRLASRLSERYARSYGETGKENTFAEHKERDVYARLGNAILAECRQVRKEARWNEQRAAACAERENRSIPYSLQDTAYSIRRWGNRLYDAAYSLLQQDTESMKNQAAYERLMREAQERDSYRR